MDILTQQQDGVLTISFNRPAKKNAITAVMYQTMADALQQAENDPAVRVIVLCGQENIFTAGNDLEDFMQNAAKLSTDGESSTIIQFMQALSSASKPVIAAVAGLAVGIGTTLLMHCDLVYLADNAKLVMPFTQLGLCPEFASSLLLQRLAGYHRAAEKLLLGEAFDAKEALAMGLANKVVPAADLMALVHQQAARLVALPATSLRATKQLMKSSQTALMKQVMHDELQQFSQMLNAQEAREAFLAFFQKRKPDFTQFE